MSSPTHPHSSFFNELILQNDHAFAFRSQWFAVRMKFYFSLAKINCSWYQILSYDLYFIQASVIWHKRLRDSDSVDFEILNKIISILNLMFVWSLTNIYWTSIANALDWSLWHHSVRQKCIWLIEYISEAMISLTFILLDSWRLRHGRCRIK